MALDARAFLADIIVSCDAVAVAVEGVDVEAYRRSRVVRSAVERELCIVGWALAELAVEAADVFSSITNAHRFVELRDQFVREHANADDVLIWGLADRDVPILRRDCVDLLSGLEDEFATL